MIDQYMSARGGKRRTPDYESYRPDLAVRGTVLLNPKGRDLAAVFSPWHGGWYGELLGHALARKGMAVAVFDLDGRILEPDVDRVQDSFHQVREVAGAKLKKLMIEGGHDKLHLYGVSLGNVALAQVAYTSLDFDYATMVVGGGSLAGSVWNGNRTQDIRHSLEDKGVSGTSLETAWEDLAPQNHAKAFEDKPVAFHVSCNDLVIPTEYQTDLESALRAAGAFVNSNHSRGGHYVTAAKFLYSQAVGG